MLKEIHAKDLVSLNLLYCHLILYVLQLYMCYHMTRKTISVVKPVLHRNCSDLSIPLNYERVPDATWCDYALMDQMLLHF